MSFIASLIFRPVQRSTAEENLLLQQDRYKYGYHLEGLAKIKGKFGYDTFPDTLSEHTSYMFTLRQLSSIALMGDELPEDKDKECKTLFYQYAKCLKHYANIAKMDPLEATDLNTVPNSKNCYPIQDSLFKVCGYRQAQRMLDNRRSEMKMGRWRRKFYILTRNLKEDLGFNRYPSSIFSYDELDKQVEESDINQTGLLEKIKSGRVNDALFGNYSHAEVHWSRGRAEIDNLKQELWPEETLEGSQKAFREYRNYLLKQDDYVKDAKDDLRGVGVDPANEDLWTNSGFTYRKPFDLSKYTYDPAFEQYLKNDPKRSDRPEFIKQARQHRHY